MKQFQVLSLFTLLLMIAIFGCDSPSPKQNKYYYSDKSINSHKVDADSLVNVNDTALVRDFIRSKSFSSKTKKMTFDDSLNVSVFNNGKPLYNAKCSVADYMLQDERLLIFKDTADDKDLRFTIGKNGIITDMQTYDLYLLPKH